jgi:SAM-dependent methyltransferase
MSEKKKLRSSTVGMADWKGDGWFNGKTGEITRGVCVSPSDTVIDVGCGDGGFIGFVAGQGAEVIFIDQDATRLVRTEARIKQSPARAYQAIQSDCNPIPLDDDVGDLVICTEVLEHVPDPVKFLGEVIRIAKPGAQLLLAVPDSRSEQFVKSTAPPQCFQVPNHIRIFSAEVFEELVLDAGLEIEEHQFTGCFWSIFWPLSWMTCEPGGGLPLNNNHPIIEHWIQLWQLVQQHPEGHKIRDALNQLLPKSQSIVARKPK